MGVLGRWLKLRSLNKPLKSKHTDLKDWVLDPWSLGASFQRHWATDMLHLSCLSQVYKVKIFVTITCSSASRDPENGPESQYHLAPEAEGFVYFFLPATQHWGWRRPAAPSYYNNKITLLATLLITTPLPHLFCIYLPLTKTRSCPQLFVSLSHSGKEVLLHITRCVIWLFFF